MSLTRFQGRAPAGALRLFLSPGSSARPPLGPQARPQAPPPGWPITASKSPVHQAGVPAAQWWCRGGHSGLCSFLPLLPHVPCRDLWREAA